MDYVFHDKYRQLFSEHIEQASNYISNLQDEDCKAKVRAMTLSFTGTKALGYRSDISVGEHDFSLDINSAEDLLSCLGQSSRANRTNASESATQNDRIAEFQRQNEFIERSTTGKVR